MSPTLPVLVFDMGRVLVTFEQRALIARVCADPTLQQALLEDVLRSAEWIMLDRGSIDFEAAYRRMAARLPEAAHEAARQLLYHWHDAVAPLPEMEALVARYHGQGHRLYILSNASRHFRYYAERISGWRYMSGAFVSAEHGLLKPEAACYAAFFEHFGLEAGDCIFVDDSAANVEGARRAGMPALVYHGDAARLARELDALIACPREARLDFA